MNGSLSRFLMGGTNSGCGKTTITCAILAALQRRGLVVQPFKCGPDYIDPMFHTWVTKRISRNLDPFMLEADTLNWLMAKAAAGADISVLEGAMGFYDGLGGRSMECSTAQVAEMTGSPVVLVVNGAGMSVSLVAMIKGFLEFIPRHTIRGVILNQVSPGLYPLLREMIEEALPVRVFGFLPKMTECSLESRHLGLVPAGEIADLERKVERLAVQAEQSIDLDGLIELAGTAPALKAEKPVFLPDLAREQALWERGEKEPLRIGVAKDPAFCFYYQDNLDLLEELGARLVPFSPLADSKLPQPVHGLYLGGGYPEVFAAQLSANQAMRRAIKEALEKGIPCIAECGGFMYLCEGIKTLEGTVWEMIGHLPGIAYMTKGLKHFGYVTLTANRDNLLVHRGESLRGHEFHYSDADHKGEGFRAEKASGHGGWECIHTSPTLAAGYPHSHFYSNPDAARRFIARCRSFRDENDRN